MTERDAAYEEAAKKKLSEDVGDCLFRDLRAHADRNALFLVAPSLDLVHVALRIALDDTESVEGWIERGELRRPSRAELSRWNDLPDQPFRSVVVQPFVLAQPFDS